MDGIPIVDAPPATHDPGSNGGGDLGHRAEPIVHLERLSGRVEVEVDNLDALFDRTTLPTYPHTGPILNKSVSNFLVDSVRQDRANPTVEATVAFRTSPLQPAEEASTRAQMGHFFANEAELAALEQRVNRSEGFGAVRYAVPVVIAAGLIAGLLTDPSTLGAPAYLTALAYLVVITVVWVTIWNPVEKLLFESYFIRLRIHALHKLASAKIAFVYRPTPAAFAGSLPDRPD